MGHLDKLFRVIRCLRQSPGTVGDITERAEVDIKTAYKWLRMLFDEGLIRPEGLRRQPGQPGTAARIWVWNE